MSRSIGAIFVALLAFTWSGSAAAKDLWEVRSGRAVFHFNTDLLTDLGIDVEVETVAHALDDEVLIEDPAWSFPIRATSNLRFHAEHGVIPPAAAISGAIRLGGTITLRDRATGKQIRIADPEIAYVPPADPAVAGRDGPEPLHLRSAGTKVVFLELIHSMFRLVRPEDGLHVHYLNARITEAGAHALGKPKLAGWVVGMGEVRAGLRLLASTPATRPPYQPVFTGGVVDVSLGRLENIQEVAHLGTWPNGTTALSMATTSCNLGTVDVPWLAPMQEDHPLIHMALYRLLDGRFEQIGVSWMKHGFFALSNSQCIPCQNPSNGDFLGVGCSDTYSVENNSSRTYLGPRSEVNPYAGTWECTASHFAGGVADCTRRHASSGHTSIDHRLAVADADLNNPGATYYYESYYVIRDDQLLENNWGSKICTMSWDGNSWDFTTPGANNPLLEGPALGRWGELRTTVDAAAGDGQVLLAVQTTDLGNGSHHFEYALLNRNSDRQIRSFVLPLAGALNITNIGFHDNDTNAANDWQVTVDGNAITWQTDTHDVDPNAPALMFGNMVNFRFDADAAPMSVDASLGLFKPGTGTEVLAATLGPVGQITGVGVGEHSSVARLIDVRPNPFNRTTTIWFETSAGDAELSIYDAAGRRVRRLVEPSAATGLRSVVWNGNSDDGSPVRAGVYYARLRAKTVTAVKSVVIVK